MAFKRGVQPNGSLYLYAGDRNLEQLAFTAGGAPWDLTGSVISAQARRVDTDADPPALEATITALDPTAGSYTMEWDGDDVRVLLDGQSTWNGVWDVQILEAGQTLPVTVHRSSVVAQMDVTR
jgi:hypothetical protein